jgi:hypothetical protein
VVRRKADQPALVVVVVVAVRRWRRQSDPQDAVQPVQSLARHPVRNVLADVVVRIDAVELPQDVPQRQAEGRGRAALWWRVLLLMTTPYQGNGPLHVTAGIGRHVVVHGRELLSDRNFDRVVVIIIVRRNCRGGGAPVARVQSSGLRLSLAKEPPLLLFR